MYNFYVGQKVKVKNWEQMVEEYGLCNNNDIHTPIYFVKSMKRYCGAYATIVKFSEGVLRERNHKIYLKFDFYDYNRWNWCIEMIEPLTKEEKDALH